MKTLIYLFTLMTSLTHNAQIKNTNKMNVKAFIDSFESFDMDIQAAGIANIPVASLSADNLLYIEYHYDTGNEKREGKMTLNLASNNRFEGNWKTDADNGNTYSGSLYFEFKDNGEALGYYKFGEVDYKITIFKNK